MRDIHGFQIGDRVKINPEYLKKSIGGFIVGEQLLDIPATIRSRSTIRSTSTIRGTYSQLWDYCIEFDENMGGHTCGGKTQNKRGLFVDAHHILPLHETQPSLITEDDLLGVLTDD